MKKVLFVLDGAVYSGAEIVLERFLNGNKEVEPYFISIYSEESVNEIIINKFGKDKLHSLYASHLPYKLDRMLPWFEWLKIKDDVKSILTAVNPDILYVNNTTEGFIFSHLLNSIKIPSLVHIHDMKSSFKDPIRKYFGRTKLEKYDRLVTVSQGTKQDWGFSKDCDVVYNGVDSMRDSENDISHDSTIRKIGFIGQLSFRKGVDLLIDFAENYLGDNANSLEFVFVYNVIQDQSLFARLVKLKNKYNENIKILEKLNSEEVQGFYKDIDVLIVPSRFDPLPTVIMESMVKGKLVIGSNVGGIPEMIESKFLFDVELKSMTAVINSVLNLTSKEVFNSRKRNVKVANEKFSSTQKLDRINGILNDLNQISLC